MTSDGGSCVGALLHAATVATAAMSRKGRGACIGVVGNPAEGVLFTNGGLVLSAPIVHWGGGRRPALVRHQSDQGEHNLAKPNFGYQKRQKELEKKRKKEEKLKKKLEKNAPPATDAPPPAPETPEPV